MTEDEILIMAGITKKDLQDLLDEDLITCNQQLHFIKNWTKYQSDYDRQKQYRQKPKNGVTPSDNIPEKVPFKGQSVTNGTTRDGDVDRDLRLKTKIETEKPSNGELTQAEREKLTAQLDDFYKTLDKPNIGDRLRADIKKQVAILEAKLNIEF
jgi:hypothetical protein